MQTTTLPYSSIIIGERYRKDYGNVQELADSIKKYGLLQLPLVDANNNLVVGGRRMAAIALLGWAHVTVGVTSTLSDDERAEQEWEENHKRKQTTWFEDCLAIANRHIKQRNKATLAGDDWSQAKTGEMFGISAGNVNYILAVAKKLKSELSLPEAERRYHKCDSVADAYKLIIREQEDLALAEKARRQQELINKQKEETAKAVADFTKELDVVSIIPDTKGNPVLNEHLTVLRQRARENYLDLNEQEQRTLYLSNHLNPPEQFEQYRQQKIALLTKHLTLEISNNFILGNSIDYMNLESNVGRFDHIITDIPYGIDMDMLDQTNTGMDVSTTAKEHDVEYNLNLIEQFFPAAFKCTKESAFVITWCDAMLFKWMHDLATMAGFNVQRWPFHWCKTQAGNQAASYNFTKATEIAIICRKPKTVMAKHPGLNYVVASREDEVSRLIDHPFAKPFACWQPLIDAVSIEGQLILEPFAGRGSGVLSMLKMNRQVVGCELNEQHYNALLENVKQHYKSINSHYVFA